MPPEKIEVTKVKVTLKRTQLIEMEFDATEDQMEELKNGNNPFFDKLVKEMDEYRASTEYRFAVDDMDGNEIVEWS